MPNINLKDSRDRDAIVKAESVSQTSRVLYVPEDGLPVYTRKILKGSLDQDYNSLLSKYEG